MLLKLYPRLLVFLLLTLPSVVRAQTDFRPGYVLSPAGDTVHGLVDYRGALRSSRLCQFRPSAVAPVTAYRPGELRGYGFAGTKEYRTCLTPLPDSAGQQQAPRLFFLEVLASGPASLYSRRDGADATYFYLQKGTAATVPVKELEFHRVIIEAEGKQGIRAVNTFRNTLSEAFADCPALSLDVLRTEYQPGELVRIVERYNACRQPGSKTVITRKKPHVSVGLLAGAQVGRLTFAEGVYQSNGKFTSGAGPVVGLALQFVSPALNEKLMLRLEVLYTQQQYDGDFTYRVPYLYVTADEQAHFKLSYLHIPLVLRYTARLGGVQPLVEFGMTASQALSIETSHRITYSSSLLPNEDWQPAVPESYLRNFEVGVLAGLGVQLPFPANRPLTVLGRVERSNGFVTARGNQNSVWRYQLLLGINLTK
jgi:hypothetical protein